MPTVIVEQLKFAPVYIRGGRFSALYEKYDLDLQVKILSVPNRGFTVTLISRLEELVIDAVKAIADALGVSTDYLLSDTHVDIKDTELLRKFLAIQAIDAEAKSVVNTFLDLIIRDHKTKQAYA